MSGDGRVQHGRDGIARRVAEIGAMPLKRRSCRQSGAIDETRLDQRSSSSICVLITLRIDAPLWAAWRAERGAEDARPLQVGDDQGDHIPDSPESQIDRASVEGRVGEATGRRVDDRAENRGAPLLAALPVRIGTRARRDRWPGRCRTAPCRPGMVSSASSSSHRQHRQSTASATAVRPSAMVRSDCVGVSIPTLAAKAETSSGERDR